MTLKKVVLPAPLGPIKPTIDPFGTCKPTESKACTPPKRLETSVTSSSKGADIICLLLFAKYRLGDTA